MEWIGNSTFLNLGQYCWTDSSAPRTNISWKLTQLRTRYLPIFLYQCKIEGWGLQAFGFGAARSKLEAAQKSYAEAWERLWINYLSHTDVNFYDVKNSNGFAAGLSNQMAIDNSKSELIERSVVLEAWAEQSGWSILRPMSLKNRLINFGFKIQGWRHDLFKVSSNAGPVLVSLLRNDEKGAIFDATFGGSLYDCEVRLFLSALKNSYFHKATWTEDIPFEGIPEDHRKYYSNPNHLAAFDFLNQKNSPSTEVILPHLDKVRTTVIVKAGPFPAVAYSSHPSWPSLSWGKNSTRGLNTWPHPIA